KARLIGLSHIKEKDPSLIMQLMH
ncbi:uncharacterized protein METZ01_LOCUS380648, partial [marine metagenome]